MLLYINGRPFEYNFTGVTRYTYSILSHLDNLLSKGEYTNLQVVLLTSSLNQYTLKFQNIEVRQIGVHHGHLWEQFDLLRYTKDHFLLSLHALGTCLKKEQVLVMHDAKSSHRGTVDNGELSRYFHLLLNLILAKNIPRIIAISEFARKDIEIGYHVSPNKIEVIYSGVEQVNKKLGKQFDITKRFQLLPKKYIFSVGGGRTKNNVLTEKAVELLKNDTLDFVLAGDVAPEVREELKQYKHTHLVGRVSNEELAALYKAAFCYAFPSLAEGWGMPPLEAMEYGCPVIASQCDSIPEVCGDGAIYLDNPHDPSEMANKIDCLLHDTRLYNKMVNKGYQNIHRFDWDTTTRKIMKVTLDEMERQGCI